MFVKVKQQPQAAKLVLKKLPKLLFISTAEINSSPVNVPSIRKIRTAVSETRRNMQTDIKKIFIFIYLFNFIIHT